MTSVCVRVPLELTADQLSPVAEEEQKRAVVAVYSVVCRYLVSL